MSYIRISLRWLSRFLLRAEEKLQLVQSPGLSRHIEPEQLSAEQLTFVTPHFVLSTGRCGTLWLTELLRLSWYAWVNHSDPPELVRHSRLAYEQYEQSPRIFCEVIRAARDDFIVRAYKRGQIYIETNNRITFFAHAIKQAYPKAKFVHLIRHPGDFVRSGLSRGWYHGQRHDVGRITKSKSNHSWQMMSDVEKIAWLWSETNRYIEDFLQKLHPQDYVQIRAEDMFSDLSTVMSLLHFFEIGDISLKTINRMLGRRVNPQLKWIAEPYPTWPDQDKKAVQRYAELATQYGYEL